MPESSAKITREAYLALDEEARMRIRVTSLAQVVSGEASAARRLSEEQSAARSEAGQEGRNQRNELPMISGQRRAACYNSDGELEIVRVDVHVGQRIRQRRWMLGCTQSQLAERVGVKFQQVQRYETGSNRVDAGRLWDIAAALEVPVSFFFDGLYVIDPEAGTVHELGEKERPGDILTDKEALELVRAYYTIPKAQRRKLFDFVRHLTSAA